MKIRKGSTVLYVYGTSREKLSSIFVKKENDLFVLENGHKITERAITGVISNEKRYLGLRSFYSN